MQNNPNRPVRDPELMRRRAEARRRRKRQVMRNRIIFALICLALLALLIFGIVKVVGLITGKGSDSTPPGSSVSTSASQPAESIPAESTPASGSADPAQSAPEAPQSAPAADGAAADPDDWRMILVNNNIALPEGYQVETELADHASGAQLQKEAAQAYMRMKDAASAAGVDLLLCSGYRSVERQTELFNAEVQKWMDKGKSEEDARDKAKTVVAVPGYSEHNTGLAADIVTPEYQVLDAGYEETAAAQWLFQHAHEFGFILRYPKDKQAITGIIYEPWHYRYVGPENAAAIQASGRCLEEYLADALG